MLGVSPATIGVVQNHPPFPPGVANEAASDATARSQEANALTMAIARMEDRIARMELVLKAHEGGAERTQERELAAAGHRQTMEQGLLSADATGV